MPKGITKKADFENTKAEDYKHLAICMGSWWSYEMTAAVEIVK